MKGRASADARGAILDVAAISGQGIACAPRQAHRPWAMADGSLEAIKWAALILMVFDHINKYLYAEQLPVIFQLGRIVMPMFGFVLAYNLARPDALAKGVHGRMMYRLTLMGLAASPMCIILNGMFVTASAWWPLNILFMLLLVVALTYLIDRGGGKRYALAIALFILGGAFVEYLWMGVLCCLGGWLFCREDKLQSSTAVVPGNAVLNRRQRQCLGIDGASDSIDGGAHAASPASADLALLRFLSGTSIGAPIHSTGVVLSMKDARRSFWVATRRNA